jgi:hypothetical protein
MRTSKGYKLVKPCRGRRLPNFRPEFADQARKLCQLGATDIELADFFDVAPETISAWRATHKEFSAAMRIGSEAANDRVERSLYQRACGYERDAFRIINGKNGVIRVPYREHVPGDVTAQKKWLCNRMPHKWRDKVDVSHEVEPEMTAAQARDDLVQFLIQHGVRILPPLMDGEAETVGDARIADPDERGDKNDGRKSRPPRMEPLLLGRNRRRAQR